MKPSPLEIILTDPKFFGLTTATLAQRAICRIADGWSLPDEWLFNDTVQAILGKQDSPQYVVPPKGAPPDRLMLIAAIRTFKSLFAAAVAIRSALWSDLSCVAEGEACARVCILSNDRRNARAVFEHLQGKIASSGYLKERLERMTADTIVLRRDDGRDVEILVVAARPGGTSLVSRWLACVVLDEVTYMLGEEEGAASLDASLGQTVGRIVPGGQIVMIGSSYAPPRGPAYEMLMGHWGTPTQELVALWATGPELNPVTYSRRNCQALLRAGRDKARAYLTRSFRDPETGFLTSDEVDHAMRSEHDIAPEDGHHYVAATDPAARKNGWALVVLDTVSTMPLRYRVVLGREWRADSGGRLKPRDVIREMAVLLRPYGVDCVYSDHHMTDALADMAEEEGLGWFSDQLHGAAKVEAFLELGRVFQDRLIEIPPNPLMRRDLLGVKKRVNQDSSLSFVLVKTPDGRHCDYVPCLVRAIMHAPDPVVDDADGERSEEERLWAEMQEHDQRGDGVLGAMERLVS